MIILPDQAGIEAIEAAQDEVTQGDPCRAEEGLRGIEFCRLPRNSLAA